MLLAVDIGNTNIVFGLFENDNFLTSFRLETNYSKTIDEYGIRFIEMIRFNNYKIEEVKGIIISSVVPQLDSIFEKMFIKYLKTKPMFVGVGTKTGINIKLDNPKQLGADILVGVVAAYSKYPTPLIVIDMGTATTFAYLNSKKEMLGGIILPGIKTSFSSLIQKTSRLEEVKVDIPNNIIGRDTVSSIQSGMIYGTVSMIDGLIRRIKKAEGEAVVVITGGESRYVINYLEEKVNYEENLILDGLKIIYNKNQ